MYWIPSLSHISTQVRLAEHSTNEKEAHLLCSCLAVSFCLWKCVNQHSKIFGQKSAYSKKILHLVNRLKMPSQPKLGMI